MLNYQSSVANQPPNVHALAQQAQHAFTQSPYGGQNHQDVFGALGQQQALDLQRYAQQQEDRYMTDQQQAQRQMALAGLTQMSQAQQQQQNLGTQRMQMLLSNLL